MTELVKGYRAEGQVSLIFPYQKSKPFLTYLLTLDMRGIKCYMFCLLQAIAELNKKGIMHRDIKPSNFLYDPDSGTGMLIDFGLSELVSGYFSNK